MSKRSFDEYLTSSETNLNVLTADGGFIPAHAEVLRLVCSCMKNAPASDTWDLRQLLVDGSPVQTATVIAVFEFIYDGLRVMDFEMDKSRDRFSLLELRKMLLFADAVGCSRRILEDMASLLGVCVSRQFTLQVSQAVCKADTDASNSDAAAAALPAAADEPATAAAAAAAAAASAPKAVLIGLDDTYHLQDDELHKKAWQRTELVETLTHQQLQQLRAGLAEQLKQLFEAAFRLNLSPLLKPLLQFIQRNNGRTHRYTGYRPLLSSGMDWTTVFTPRMLSTAGPLAASLVAQACVQKPLGTGIGFGSLFYFEDDDRELDSVSFYATLGCDFAGFRDGAVVEVEVDLQYGGLIIQSEGREAAFAWGAVLSPPDLLQTDTPANKLRWQ